METQTMELRDLGNACVLGLQWGDEGKGKVVDLLLEHFDVAVRYAGGPNAGHTVVAGDQKFALHQLPSGVLRPGVINVIAGGAVIDPAGLLGEIESLRQRGITVGDNLRISSRAHVVLPHHRREDVVAERAAPPQEKLGTTARGVGPCYTDKVARRWALRVCDLYHPEQLRQRLAGIVAQRTAYFSAVYEARESFDAAAIAQEYLALAEQLRPFVCDTTVLLHQLRKQGKRILLEGAQGSLLDVDHGTYPFVTSSSTIAYAAGAGMPAASVKSVIGVVKVYATRVGAGPFPTELTGAIGQTIRTRGSEYGTTTGRPRRCGWLDAVAAAYAVKVVGPTHLAVMHMDTLSGFEQLKICTAYRCGERLLNEFPADTYTLEQAEPVYETLPGWEADLRDCRELAELPTNARAYLDYLSRRLDVPVGIVGVGPSRAQTIIVSDSG